MSDAMSTLGGSPMAVAAPPILEKITVAIKTWTEIKKENAILLTLKTRINLIPLHTCIYIYNFA